MKDATLFSVTDAFKNVVSIATMPVLVVLLGLSVASAAVTTPDSEKDKNKQPVQYYALGDSIAEGLRTGAKLPGLARVGASPQAVLGFVRSVSPSDINGKTVILSSGASNCAACTIESTIRQQVKELRAKGARVILLGVGPAYPASLNQLLQRIAQEEGATFSPLTRTAGDGVHPASSSELLASLGGKTPPPGTVVADTKAPPGVTTPPPGLQPPPGVSSPLYNPSFASPFTGQGQQQYAPSANLMSSFAPSYNDQLRPGNNPSPTPIIASNSQGSSSKTASELLIAAHYEQTGLSSEEEAWSSTATNSVAVNLKNVAKDTFIPTSDHATASTITIDRPVGENVFALIGEALQSIKTILDALAGWLAARPN